MAFHMVSLPSLNVTVVVCGQRRAILSLVVHKSDFWDIVGMSDNKRHVLPFFQQQMCSIKGPRKEKHLMNEEFAVASVDLIDA